MPFGESLTERIFKMEKKLRNLNEPCEQCEQCGKNSATILPHIRTSFDTDGSPHEITLLLCGFCRGDNDFELMVAAMEHEES